MAPYDYVRGELAWGELKITQDEILGRGTFGDVERATLRGKPVAVKMVTITKEEQQGCMTEEQFYQEAELLTKMAAHTNIIRLIAISKKSKSKWAFVLELAERGSLAKYLKQEEQISLVSKWHMAMQIADAMRYLHGQDKPVVHRDLKPDNILVMHDGTIRITDFGTARPLDGTSLATQLMGTRGYIPPDTNEKQTEKFDVYSFGVVLWQLLTHEAHLPTRISMEHEAMRKLGRPWHELVEACLHLDPEARPSFYDIHQRLAGLFFPVVSLTIGTLALSQIRKEDTGTYGENVNIWEEPDGPQYSHHEITPDGEVIHYGTLNKLVVHLTAAHNTDVRFMRAFLMTYLSFTNPSTLLKKLIDRYHVPATTHSAPEVKRIQLRVCNALKHWISNHFDDLDSDLIQTVVSFIDESLAIDGYDSIVTVLRNTIVKKVCGLKSRVTRGRQVTHLPNRSGASPPPKLEIKNDKWSMLGMSIFDYDEEEVARQFTIREFLLYREIGSSELRELFYQSWNKEKPHHKALNVLETIRKFNEVSMWVTALILEPVKVKHRAKRWEFLIRTASHLLQLNNFNLLMSFVSGMNNSCILRLKFTKGLLSKRALDTLERLQKLMSPAGSYKEYRETLAAANPPCIPYIGVHLFDLVLIEDGNPDEINGLINWDKRALVHKVIDLLGQYQNSVYNLTYVYAISHLLQDVTSPSEEDLFEVSLQREPHGAQKSQVI